MRKMFTRLFSLALLLLLFSAVSVVNAQNHCGPTISASDVKVVTDLTTVCDGDPITYQVVGYAGAEFAFNFDGDVVGGFTTDSAFTVDEGDPFRVLVRVNDSCYSNDLTVLTDVVEPITIGDATAEHPTCGDTLGEITVNFTGGIGDFTYWIVPIDSFGTGVGDFNPDDYDTPTANNSAKPGTYVVTVQDQNMCFDITDNNNWDTVKVNATTPAVMVDDMYTDTIDCYMGTASVTVEVSGGIPAESVGGLIVQLYDVSDLENEIAMDTAFSGEGYDPVVFVDIPAGEYVAMVFDSIGCEAKWDSTLVLDAPEEVEFEIEVTDVSCADAGNGAIQVAITNYVAGVEYAAYVESADSVYAWVLNTDSPEDSLIQITGLDPVYYSLYVKDSTNNCTVVEYDNGNESGNNITVQSPGEIEFAVMFDSIPCYGDSTWVSIDSLVGGNGSGYEYQLSYGPHKHVMHAWNDTTSAWLLPSRSEAATNWHDHYILEVRNADGDGCGQAITVEVVQADEFEFDYIETIEPTCPGGNDGLIVVNVMGGSGNYSYSIDNVTWYTNNSFTVEADNYTVYVKDVDCDQEISSNVSVSDLDEFLVEWDAPDTITLSCFGDSTYVDIDWNNDERSDEDRDVTLFVTQNIDSVFVGGLAVEDMPNDGDDEPYLGEGTYYVWASDDFGCVSSNYDTIVILQPDELMVNAWVTEHATCNDDNDGIITIEAPDNYDWTNLSYVLTNSYAAALVTGTDHMTAMPDSVVNVQAAAGTWYAVLYDNYCGVRKISQEMVVNSYDPVVVADTAISVTDIVCNGDSAGVIVINAATGGSGDLVYTLYNGSGETDTVAGYVEVTDTIFTGLKGGSYWIGVTDMGAAGCDGAMTGKIVVMEPSKVEIDEDYEVYDISCSGASDGRVVIDADGGVNPNDGPYQFKIGTTNWRDFPEDTPDDKTIVITEAGFYDIWIRDSLGCVSEPITVHIVEPDPLTVEANGTDDTTACGPSDDGMIEVVIEGGKDWDGLTYLIEVAGVDTVDNVAVDSIHVFTNVAPGEYEVYVTEEVEGNPCTQMAEVTIDTPDTIAAVATVVQDVACKDGETGIISLAITGGSEEYDVWWTPAVGTIDTNMVISELPAGMYEIKIADYETFPGDCMITLDTVVITEPDDYLTLEATKIQDITCAEPGKFSVQAEGGVGEYMYAAALSELPEHIVLPPAPDSSAWQSDSTFSVTVDGTWIVWVMDENKCIVGGEYDDEGVVVNEWRIPIAKPKVEVLVWADEIKDSMLVCNGDMTAAIVIDDVDIFVEEEIDETRGYTVTIDGVANDTLTGLGAGTYVVVVTDTLSGCTGTDTVVIEDPIVLDVVLDLGEGEFTCPEVVEGYIEATAFGGMLPSDTVMSEEGELMVEKSASEGGPYMPEYMYQLWQNGVMKTDYQEDNSFLVEVGNDYQVVVKYNGCTDTSNVIEIDPVAAVEIVDIMDITCTGDTAASVKVTATGEAGRMFQVKWEEFEGDNLPDSDTSAWFEGSIDLDQRFMFDNENTADVHYEFWIVDDKGCVSEKDTVTFDQVITSPLELTVAEGVVNGCGTEVTMTATGGVAPYVIMVDDMEVTDDMVVLGGGMHTIKVMDLHECSVMKEITLDYPMARVDSVMTYTGEAVAYSDEAAGLVDTMLYVGEYTFYYAVDTTCENELVVVVTEKDRTQPVVTGVSPTDTLEDNHPTFEITFDGPVTFNDSVMGYLTVTPKDSTEALLMIAVTADMVDEANGTITVDYTVAEGDLGLDKNTTYVVAVDSGIVIGDGLAWDGTTPAWMFTTGADWATGITPGFAQEDFKVYPNPFNDFIRVDNYDKLDRVIVSNIAGQRVLDIKYPSYEIRTGNLVTGVYVVTLIKDNSIVKSERIIKR